MREVWKWKKGCQAPNLEQKVPSQRLSAGGTGSSQAGRGSAGGVHQGGARGKCAGGLPIRDKSLLLPALADFVHLCLSVFIFNFKS